MDRQLFLPVLLAIIGLTYPSFSRAGFTLRIVDEQTGTGIPNLRITDGAGMVRRTGSHGELIVWGTSMPLSVGDRFEVRDEQGEFVNIAAVVKVTPGGAATLNLHRRAYR
jgi:hypothetical protein